MNQETSIVPLNLADVVKSQKVEALVEIFNQKMAIPLKEILDRSSTRLITAKEKMEVTNAGEEEQAIEFLSKLAIDIKTVKKSSEEYRDKTHKIWQGVKAIEDSFLCNLVEADKIVRDKLRKYALDLEQKREKEEAEAERKRKIKEDQEKAKLNDRADNWDSKGNCNKAEDLREQAETTFIPVTLPPEAPKTVVSGSGKATKSKDIEVLITDEFRALESILSGKLPIASIKFNLNTIKRTCKDNKYKTGDVPGVQIKTKINISVNAKKII